jgi:phage major head subunit gpT-like protein
MLITPQSLNALAQGFNAHFLRGFESAQPSYQQIAMTIPSTGSAENYAWMKDMPGMREWVGQRVINNLESTGAQLVNKHWEHTIGVNADAIEDDILGIYSVMFAQEGEIAARHPDDLVWSLLANGFVTPGFDGQNFFDADHTSYNRSGQEVSWSNVQTGTASPWFLLDLSRNFMKPLIFQSRKSVQFTRKASKEDDNVFFENTYLFGADARYTAGFGFHQLAFGSTDDLTADNYAAARVALATQFRPDGSPLAIRPTHLVVGPTNEAAARKLLNTELINGGDSNPWFKSAELIVSPYLV